MVKLRLFSALREIAGAKGVGGGGRHGGGAAADGGRVGVAWRRPSSKFGGYRFGSASSPCTMQIWRCGRGGNFGCSARRGGGRRGGGGGVRGGSGPVGG